jgi:hypothetical protein
MVEHFGHFTHKPSGISFLRDLAEDSLGLRKKEVLEAGGGVTPGSTFVSTPKAFFVKEVVAIFFKGSFSVKPTGRARKPGEPERNERTGERPHRYPWLASIY